MRSIDGMTASHNGASPSRFKVWLIAVRPWAYPASVLPVLVGTAVAWTGGVPLHGVRFGLALLGVVAFHTAANLLNDVYDFERGLDAEPMANSGAIVRGWLTTAQVKRAVAVMLAVGMGCGLFLAWGGGWVVLALGAAGAVLALAYTRPGVCLKYSGWGDAGIFSAFGLLPVFGAFWVQAQAFRWEPLFWSMPVGAHIVAILHANNWTDMARDRRAGCRTLATRLGRRGSAVYYRALILGPYLLVALAAFAGSPGGRLWDRLPLLGTWLSLPLALKLSCVHPDRDPSPFAELDSRTALLQMAFGLLLLAGLVLSHLLRAA